MRDACGSDLFFDSGLRTPTLADRKERESPNVGHPGSLNVEIPPTLRDSLGATRRRWGTRLTITAWLGPRLLIPPPDTWCAATLKEREELAGRAQSYCCTLRS